MNSWLLDDDDGYDLPRLVKKSKDGTDEVIRITINGGMCAAQFEELGISPPPPLKFNGLWSKRCIVYNGLPDLLPGETDLRYQVIYSASSDAVAVDYAAQKRITDLTLSSNIPAAPELATPEHAPAAPRSGETELDAAMRLRHAKRLAPGPTGK